jgi:spermidine synthase
LPTALRGLGFTRVEAAEPAAGIVDAVRLHFSFPGAIPVLPRDGRDLLRDSLKVYDLIAMEIHNPLLSGQAHLHSREFCSLARSRLKPGGLLQQWIPLVSLADAESAVATVRSVFPVVSLYLFGGQALVVAGDREQRITSDGRRAVYEFLLWHFNRQQSRAEEYLRAILQAEVLDASGVDRLAQSGAVVITDWNRRLEMAAPRHALDEAEAATADASLAGLRQYATAR